MASAAVAALAAALPAASTAQVIRHRPPAPERWADDVAVLGANAVIGGAAAAVTAWIGGRDVGDAFLAGAFGGGVAYAGKRVAVQEFDGAGLLGRQLSAVGGSVMANGARGAGWLDEVWLPLGPLWVRATPGDGSRMRLDASEVGLLAWAASQDALELDTGASLSNGAFVFRSPDHYIRLDDRTVGGFAATGVMVLGPSSLAPNELRRHELVHVLQQDLLIAAGRPLERWLWSAVTGREPPLDFGALRLLMMTPLDAVTEGEANHLMRR